MKKFITTNRNAFTGLCAILLLGGSALSFQDASFMYNRFNTATQTADTLPDQHKTCPAKTKDCDKLFNLIDHSLMLATDEINKTDFSMIKKELEASLKEIDMNRIMKDVESSLKDIDLNGKPAIVQNALHDIDRDKINAEIKAALATAGRELDKALAEIKKIDKEAIRKELDQARKQLEQNMQ